MLQVSKALVNSFFYIFVFNVSKCSICSFTDARPSLFSVPQNCLERMRYFNPRQIHHENMAQIYFTEKNTYIYSKRANFITKYGSRKRGMRKYGPSKYQWQRSDLSLDYLAIWYSSIVVPIHDVRYWPSLFGLDGWKLAEFFYTFMRTGTKSWSINTQKRMRLISSHLDRTSLIYKGLIIQKKAFALLRIRYDFKFNLRAGEKSQLCL